MSLKTFILIVLLGTAFPNSGTNQFLDLSYNLDIKIDVSDGNHQISGLDRVSVTNHWDQPIGELYFHLTPNSGDNAGNLVIESSHATREIRISGEDSPSMQIGLFPALKPGEQIIIDLTFTTTLQKKGGPELPFVYEQNDYTILLSQHFYPILECFHEDGWHIEHHGHDYGHPKEPGAYEVTIRTPNQYSVITATNPADMASLPLHETRYTFAINQATDFAFVATTTTKEIKGTIAGADITFYPSDTKSEATNLSKMLNSILPIYSSWFGSLPQNKMVFIAFPGLPARALSWHNMIVYHPDLIDSHTLGHELARQWLGFLVYAANPNEVWLNESLSEYYVWRYEKYLEEQNKSVVKRHSNVFQQLFYNYRSFNPDEWMRFVLETMGDRVDYPKYQPGKNTHWESSSHLYSQYVVGSHALQLLEHKVGANKTLDIVSTYIQDYAGKAATTEDFIRIVKEKCGPETAQNFRLALTTNIRPDIQIRNVSMEEPYPHKWETRVTTKYEGEWVLPVDALAITQKGDSLTQKQLILSENNVILFQSTEPIKTILIDPENRIYDANRFNNRWPRRLIFRPLIGKPSWDVYSVSYRPRLYRDWLHNWRFGIRITGGLGLNLMPIMPALFQNSFNLDLTFSTGMPTHNWGTRFTYRTPLSSIHLTYWDVTADYAYPRNRQVLSLINYIGEPSYYLTSGRSIYNRLVTQVRRIEYTDTLSSGWWEEGIQYWISEEFQRFYYTGDKRYMIQVFGLVGHSMQSKDAFNRSRIMIAADGEQHLWDWLIARGHLESGFTWDSRPEDVLRYRLQYLPRIWKERENFVPLYRGFVDKPNKWWNTVAGAGVSFGYETEAFAWPMLYMDMAFVSTETGSAIERLKALSFSSNAYVAAGLGVESQSMVELGVYFPLWLSSPPLGEPNWYPRVIFQWGFYF